MTVHSTHLCICPLAPRWAAGVVAAKAKALEKVNANKLKQRQAEEKKQDKKRKQDEARLARAMKQQQKQQRATVGRGRSSLGQSCDRASKLQKQHSMTDVSQGCKLADEQQQQQQQEHEPQQSDDSRDLHQCQGQQYSCSQQPYVKQEPHHDAPHLQRPGHCAGSMSPPPPVNRGPPQQQQQHQDQPPASTLDEVGFDLKQAIARA